MDIMSLVPDIAYAVVGFILVYVIVLRGLFVIRDNQVGVLRKKFGGTQMPQGQVIARKGQVGTLAQTLMPNLYWRFPFFWEKTKFPITDIGEDQVGIVEAIDGATLPKGRTFADEIDSNHFQDGEAFLVNGGIKGLQIAVLTTGKYRINPVLFKVSVKPATVIDSSEVGIVSAQDGQPLPQDLRIAPAPEDEIIHKQYQNGQAFITSKGYKGVQQETLQTGKN
jgi:uncharacterized membrane protein YqiK